MRIKKNEKIAIFSPVYNRDGEVLNDVELVGGLSQRMVDKINNLVRAVNNLEKKNRNEGTKRRGEGDNQ